MKKYAIILCLVVLLAGCAADGTRHVDDPEAVVHHPRYARGFDIVEHSNFVEILLYNPWKDSEILTRYYLVKHDTIDVPDDGMKIKVPVRSVASTSVTQLEFLRLIGETGSITAVCSPDIIYNEQVRERYREGQITSLGDAFNLNTERLMVLDADIVLATFYNQSSVAQQVAEASSIRMVYDNEWTESSPLARAEWIKFVAAFYDKMDVADSIFDGIDSSYQQAKRLTASVKHRKSVLMGGNFRGTWYMPGGGSYMGTLIKDAHASYYYENDTTTGSLPLNFETVLHNFSGVDAWLYAPAATMSELASMDERHKLFAPYSSGEVYGFFRRLTPSLSNDFWESAVAHPDLILKDITWALYPELLPDYEPVYILRIE